jgi:hypothetical protein
MTQLYKVVRNFQSGKKRIIKTDQTLEQAQKHCQDPDTNSTTCNAQIGYELRTKGAWFDSYTEE